MRVSKIRVKRIRVNQGLGVCDFEHNSVTWITLSLSYINRHYEVDTCLLYTSPSPRDVEESRMPSSA